MSSIKPGAGTVSGNTPVTVTGSGFRPGATLRIGGANCTQTKVVSPTTIVGVTAANGAGVKRVTVLNTATDSSGANGLFTHNHTTDATRTTQSHFDAAGTTRTNVRSAGIDSTLRWTNWTPATGGSIANGTYYYVLTAVNAVGESRRSVQSTPITLAGANNAIRLGWTALAGAIQYRLYRTTTSGTYSTPALIASVDSTGYLDVAASASAGAPPSSNTATGDLFLVAGTTPASSYSPGPATTANVGADGFSIQRPNGTFLIVHANNLTSTSIYDPVAGTMAAGPVLTAMAQEGAHALKRSDGKFLVVVGDARKTTNIYDPVANTFTAGPDLLANADKGAHAIARPNGTFLIVHGNNATTTSVYDPAAGTMTAGPVTTAVVGIGACSLPRPDGKFLIIVASNSTSTSLYDPVANTMSAGPALTAAADKGAHSIQRPDGRWLIMHGSNSTGTSLYAPIANTISAGPATSANVESGAHSILRADGTFLIIHGHTVKTTSVYDPVANTMAAGPATPDNVDVGGHALQRPDGKYLIVEGSAATRTALYDAGWYRTGSYISEKINPADINWWNLVSWVRDLDDTLTVFVRTASSSAGLDVASWRSVANGDSVGAAAGEKWLQLKTEYARAIPRSSLTFEDVWGRWCAEVRSFARPNLVSVTANYTPTTLSVTPSKSTITFGAHETNTWVPADSVSLLNDGTSAGTLLARITSFVNGATSWGISTTSNGVNQIRAQWSTQSAVGPWTDIAAYDNDFNVSSTVAVGSSLLLYLRLLTPTSTAFGVPFSSTLRITAQ